MALLCNNTETLKKKKPANLTFSVMDYTTDRSLVIDFQTVNDQNEQKSMVARKKEKHIQKCETLQHGFENSQ